MHVRRAELVVGGDYVVRCRPKGLGPLVDGGAAPALTPSGVSTSQVSRVRRASSRPIGRSHRSARPTACRCTTRATVPSRPRCIELVTPVLGVVQRVLERHLRESAGLVGGKGQGGAVTLIQRFGSAANLDVHLHCLVLDGVYRSDAEGVPEFIEAAAPTDEALHALLHTVIARLMKMLTRRGVLVEDTGRSWLAEPDADGDEAPTLRPLQAAAVTYRIAFGSRAGQKVLTLRGAMPREVTARQPLCADVDGFSLHAAVRIEAHERRRLERLCRYITRPALSDERIQVNAAGQVELELKTPWRDGTTHLVMSPLAFMQRLAALVPRPRLHLIRYHGVLAPNAKLRARVVPQGPPAPGHAATEVEARAECEEAEPVRARPQRMGWARLLKRVFDIDLQRCPRCGAGQVKIIAAILERAVIGKILTHLGLDPQPPPRSKAGEAGLEFAA
jgi:hypothetical protein